MLTLYSSFVAKIWLQSAEIGKIALVISLYVLQMIYLCISL